MVAVGLSFFVLLRPASVSLQKDIKAAVKRLEREWEDVQERLDSSSGRLAKQRGLFEKAQLAKTPLKDFDPVLAPEPVRRTRSSLFAAWRLKHADKQDSSRPIESGGSNIRSPGEPGV